jgi:hypothetical protein
MELISDLRRHETSRFADAAHLRRSNSGVCDEQLTKVSANMLSFTANARETMPQVKPQSDLAGRVSGLLTFFGGIVLLVLVFYSAWDLFHTPVLSAPQGSKGADPTAMGLGTAVVGSIIRLLTLGLLTVVASLVTSKGIHIYFAANGWTDGASHGPRVREHEDAPAPSTPPLPGKQKSAQ